MKVSGDICIEFSPPFETGVNFLEYFKSMLLWNTEKRGTSGINGQEAVLNCGIQK